MYTIMSYSMLLKSFKKEFKKKANRWKLAQIPV